MESKSRDAFEKAFKNWHPDKTGPYVKHIAEYFWQASRSALVVELPKRQEPTSSGHYGEGYLVASASGSALDYEDTVDAIRAAGITVKGEGDESN